MAVSLDGQLVVAISSRALFDFEEENQVFEQGDDRAYMKLQLDRLDEPARPGVAFSLVRKLLAFNDAQAQRVEVVVLSRNDPVSGLRVFRSAEHYGLSISRGNFTRGESPWRYLAPLHANLFLSAHLPDVRAALQAGVPAAQVYPHSARASEGHPHEVRIAFDGDAVLFSDEAERVFRSAEHYGLSISRGNFTRGESPWRYLAPLHANLFLSAHLPDVRAALEAGVPAAQVYPHSARASERHPHEVRIAFDGDAVLFSDEAEQVFQTQGLDRFQAHERENVARPLPAGPFKPLLSALHRLQQEGTQAMRVRTALVTARSAPAHERAVRTLMDWNIAVDEAMFLGGLDKGPFLREFEPDFFFDDQTGHIESAARHVPAGHVASGVSNG